MTGPGVDECLTCGRLAEDGKAYCIEHWRDGWRPGDHFRLETALGMESGTIVGPGPVGVLAVMSESRGCEWSSYTMARAERMDLAEWCASTRGETRAAVLGAVSLPEDASDDAVERRIRAIQELLATWEPE